MKTLVFKNDIRERFMKTRKAFDRRVDGLGALKMAFKHNLNSSYLRHLRKRWEVDEKSNQQGKLSRKAKEMLSGKIKCDFSIAFKGTEFPFVPLLLYYYNRSCGDMTDYIIYVEVYRPGMVYSYIGRKDDVYRKIIECEQLFKDQGKMLQNIIEYGTNRIKPPGTYYKDYTYNWYDHYKPKMAPTVFPGEFGSLLNNKALLELVNSIIGYTVLAYERNNCRIKHKIQPLNVITDDKSLDSVKAIIKECFIWTGSKDSDGIEEYTVSSKSKLPKEHLSGRCVIINAINKSLTALEDFMPLYFEYTKVVGRNVDFPYKFLPIIISDKDMGRVFFNVEANGLDNCELTEVLNMVHKLYEAPVYYEHISNKYDAKSMSFGQFYERIQLLIESNSAKYLRTHKVTHNQSLMALLVMYCCYWAIGNMLWCTQDLLDMYSIEDIYVSINDVWLPNSIQMYDSVKPVVQYVQEISTSENILENAKAHKIIDFINGEVKLRHYSDKSKNNTLFIHQPAPNDQRYLAISKETFSTISKKLNVENYGFSDFRDDCQNLGLLITDNGRNLKNIKINGKAEGCIALKITEGNPFRIEYQQWIEDDEHTNRNPMFV